MQIQSITTGGVSASVWAAATRSLTVDPATDAGAATLVWARATRKLTAFGAASDQSAANSSLAASTSIDFRPSAGKIRLWTVTGTAGAAGTLVIAQYDGTTAKTILSIAAGTTGSASGYGSPTTGLRLTNNDAANPATYQLAAMDITL